MNDWHQFFAARAGRHREVAEAAFAALTPAMAQAAEMMIAAYRSGGKALFCGNGGSAADAQHLAAEFVGRYLAERRPLPALALHANSSALTAIGNDYGYEQSFSRPLEALARPGDVLVGLSTSGNSGNVVAAFARARELGVKTIALTGQGGGQLAPLADVLLAVPSRETPRIQECHILIGHCLCEAVEIALFPNSKRGGRAVGTVGQVGAKGSEIPKGGPPPGNNAARPSRAGVSGAPARRRVSGSPRHRRGGVPRQANR